MKFSFFLVACCFAISLMSGCTNIERAFGPVSQKTSASQVSSYKPPYAHDSGPNLGVFPQNQPYPGTPPVIVPAPVPHPPIAPVTGAKVAILLPLSGKNAVLGQAMLNAAQQAVFDAAGPNFELEPRDTEPSAEAAARAAIASGAQLIIGPLFAADVPPVISVAANSGVSMLTLSTDTSLAGRDVYVMGLAPGPQVERIVTYASMHGIHRYAALVPSTPYGSLVGGAFQTAVAQNGGAVVDYETYDPASPSNDARIKAIADQSANIDAIFLPESGAELKNIVDHLAADGLDSHTRLLGTGLWDVPDLAHQNSKLVGAWYAAPDPASRRTFTANYAAAYGQQPPRLATLAYDATALAAVLAKRGGRYDASALTNPNGFAGLDGIFRLTPSGAVERGLAVNEVTVSGPRVIDASPTSFVAKH